LDDRFCKKATEDYGAEKLIVTRLAGGPATGAPVRKLAVENEKTLERSQSKAA
jgi:hypothetical protein